MNPVDTPSAVRKVLRLPDLVLCIAERLPDQDRVNLAATNHALRAIIDDRIALWKVPSDHTTRPGQVARVNWRDAWSERANRAQPALRTALEKSLLSRPGDASRVGGQHLEVPDIFSAPYTGLEHLVCRARHFARRIGSETAPYTAPLGRYIEQRDLNVAAACRLGASIGLDLSQLETDLSKLEAHHQTRLYSDLAVHDAHEGYPEGMDWALRHAEEAAEVAGEEAPDVPEDLKLEAYARGMTRDQAHLLSLARECDVSGLADHQAKIARFAKRIGIPVPNPMPTALVEACREGLAAGMRQARHYAKVGRVRIFEYCVNNLDVLATIADLPAPIVSADLILEAHTNGRDVAMERASQVAQATHQDSVECMESYIEDSHAWADKVGIPRLELTPDVKRQGYRNGAAEKVRIATLCAQELDVDRVVALLTDAAQYTLRAGDALNWDTFKSVRDMLEACGGNDAGRVLALFQRLTRKRKRELGS